MKPRKPTAKPTFREVLPDEKYLVHPIMAQSYVAYFGKLSLQPLDTVTVVNQKGENVEMFYSQLKRIAEMEPASYDEGVKKELEVQIRLLKHERDEIYSELTQLAEDIEASLIGVKERVLQRVKWRKD